MTMKTNTKYLFLALFTFLLSALSCTKEKTNPAEIEKPYYNVTDDTSDPVQHEKAVLFNSYKTYLITNPTIRDYAYNFANKNKISIVAPEQSNENLLNGIKMLKETFLDLYPEDFKKKNLPFSIILSDTLRFTGIISIDGEIPPKPEYYAWSSTSFIAISGIRKNMGANPQERKDSIRGEINSHFWTGYLAAHKGLFTIPDSFYEISKDNYGKTLFEDPATIDYYQYGFVGCNKLATIYDEIDGWMTDLPREEMDLQMWVAFIFRTPKTKLQPILDANEKMAQKYEILRDVFKASGYNIDNILK